MDAWRNKYLAALLTAAIILCSPEMARADIDTFNRSDNSDLGTQWGYIPGRYPCQIVSTAVRTSTQLATCEEWYGPVIGTDQTNQVTIAALTGASVGSVGVASRMDTGSRTYYACVADKNSSATELIEYVSGAATLLNSDATSWTAGDIIRIDSTGSTHTCYKNGGSLFSGSSSAIASGHPGLRVREDGANLGDSQADDFFTSLSSAPAGGPNVMVIVVE